MRRKWVITAVVTIVAVGGGTAAFFAVRRNESTKPAAQVAPAAPAEVYVGGSGVLHAINPVKVGVPVEGFIEAFHAEVGIEVAEGQLLAQISSEASQSREQQASAELERAQDRVNRLESALAAARLEASRASADATRAKSEFERASRAYERQKILIAEGATPRRVFEKAEQEYKALEAESRNLTEIGLQAESRLASTEKELANARKLLEGKADDLESAKARVAAGEVTAPVAGIIAARRGAPGEEVNPAMDDLFQIAPDISTLQVAVELKTTDLPRVQVGQQAFVSPADMPEVAFEGTVKAVENGKVVVVFGNPNPEVKPGATVQVRIKVT